MKIGALYLFERRHSNGTPCKSINIAALHWKWSLTWRWVLVKGEYQIYSTKGFSFTRTYKTWKEKRTFNFHACFNSKITGHWSLQTQPNMQK